jgi:hypothetical protein
MARYIVIDNCSGYIFGDTADICGRTLSLGDQDEDFIAACRAIDESVLETGRAYTVLGYHNPRLLAANEGGYLVYRADIDGSEAVPVIDDGQDRELIAAVERDCRLVAIVRCVEVEENVSCH